MGTVSTTLPSDGQTIDASDVNTPINAILSEFNGNIDDNNIKTGANINGAKLLAASVPGSALDTTLAGGWISGGLPAYSSATNNGNKSYDIVFASTVASLLSPGMRLRTTRTVTAPTQCADLESGSSQYFSSASAGLAGMTFTDDFTCSAWIKLESYTGAVQRIITRYTTTTAANGWSFHINVAGQLVIEAGNASAYEYATSYQSVPLNKWVHVAGSIDLSGNAYALYIDGVSVLLSSTGALAALVQAGDLCIGNRGGGAEYFDGKLAQVAVFSSVLSASTIRSYMNQGLSGSETNLVSAFSCNNTLLDLNTTNNNDLTANGGAVMTNADSPFGQDSNGVTAGTTDYALVMKVSTTTATVQVPEGCTIPTSGGVSAVAYSTTTSPFGFTLDKGRWEVGTLLRINTTQASPVTNTWYNMTSTSGVSGGTYLTVPVGNWQLTYTAYLTGDRAAASAVNFQNTLSTSSSTESDMDYTMEVSGNNVLASGGQTSEEKRVSVTTATPYYLNTRSITAGSTNVYLIGSRSSTRIYAIPAGV